MLAVLDDMLQRLVDAARGAHGAESRRGHSERLEEPLPHQLLVGSAGPVRSDAPGNGKAPVGVEIGGAGRVYRRLLQEKAEGVVFKRIGAPYVPGRPASGGTQLKYKFTRTATCAVLAVNDKRSIQLAIAHQGVLQFVGNVTIQPNFDIPKSGSLVEVRYLYAYPNGSLYQPIYLGPRLDLDTADEHSSLKFKQGSEDS